jgi:hypothetical protein
MNSTFLIKEYIDIAIVSTLSSFLSIFQFLSILLSIILSILLINTTILYKFRIIMHENCKEIHDINFISF